MGRFQVRRRRVRALVNNGTTIPNPNPFDSRRRRTYRNEVTFGLYREIVPGVRGSVTYISRRGERSDRHGGPVAGPVGRLVPAGAGDRSR